jgi:phage-related protein
MWYIKVMDDKDCVIYRGQKFILEWYYNKNGKSVAFDYFMESTEELQDKFLVLVKKMGDFGKIFDKTKFRNEGDGIYAFKPQPDRYLSFFTDGKKIIVTNGFRKKSDKLPKNEKELAIKYRQDYIERKTGGKK